MKGNQEKFDEALKSAKTLGECWVLCVDFSENSRNALTKMLGMINDQREMGKLVYRFMTEWVFPAGEGQDFLNMLVARVEELSE